MLEHLIGLVENDSLESREIDVSSLDMVKHTATRSHKEVNASSEGSGLVFNIDSTIDSQRVKLILTVLQFGKLILHLQSKKNTKVRLRFRMLISKRKI